MKRLESVKLVQFLLYEQQEFRLEEITGLFGRNGSGKSSALDAVQIAMMGANKNQFMKALVEAETYRGPSLIIAYSPCINHGFNMGKSQLEEKRAVEAGYWPLYRYNPLLKEEGKNPFTLDSKEPSADYREFIMGEVRFSSLTRTFPDNAEELFVRAEEDMKDRYEIYKRMAAQGE